MNRFFQATRMRLELTTRIHGHQLSRLADYQLSHLVMCCAASIQLVYNSKAPRPRQALIKIFFGQQVTVQLRGPRGATTEAIRRDRVKSSRVLLAALGVIFPWNPLATLSFHQENSAIAEGLVPLRVPGLEFTGLGVLCLRCRPSGSPARDMLT